jgi:hypothetical protein
MPESTRWRRAWRQAAAEIEHYRCTYHITDPDRALGPEPHDPGQRADRQRARAAIERVHAKQRAADRTYQRQPTSERSNPRDLAGDLAGEAPSGPLASTNKGVPDGHFSTLALRRQ